MNMNSYSCCSTNTKEIRQLNTISPVLKLIAEENRLKLLCILKQGEHCVCEFIHHLGISQSLISHHLKDLKKAGLVEDEKRGLWVYYKLTEKGKRITDVIFDL